MSEYEMKVLRAIDAKNPGDLLPGAAFNAAVEALIGNRFMTRFGTVTDKGREALSA